MIIGWVADGGGGGGLLNRLEGNLRVDGEYGSAVEMECGGRGRE